MPKRRKTKAGGTDWAAGCRESLGDYYLAVNPSYEYVAYQQERLIPALEGLERGDFDRLMVLVPSGHAKSDIATKAFIPWYLGRNAGRNAILLCHTDPLAKDFGSDIRNKMARNDVHHAVFPNLKVDNANHASNFFRTNQGNSFYAFGMDGALTGRRADLIDLDDPIKNLQDALSETVQHALYETFRAVVKDRLRPGGKILMVVTRWAPRDLAGRILEDEADRWKVLVLPAEEDGKYLWEEFYGRDHYEQFKADSYIWNAKWMQAPTPRLSQGFKQEWLRFYLPPSARPEYREVEGGGAPVLIAAPVDYDKLFRMNCYILCDPAMGKAAAADRSCILVLAAGPDHRLFLVDAVLDRLDPIERTEALTKLVKLWKPKQVVYEEYALQADSVFLNQRLQQEGATDVVITSVGRKAIKGIPGGRLKKDDRIMQLLPDFRDGKIWLPKRMVRKLVDGSDFDIIGYFINREYLPWAGEGSVAHEDMLDCLARIHDPEIVIEYAERESEESYDEEGYRGGAGGTWESAL